MKTYIITDTHYFHQRLIEWGDRPENFTELIIENCKSMINPEDTVIHLGDVIFGTEKEKRLTEIMNQLPGNWILIRGNHDEKPTSLYLRSGFKLVLESLVMDDILFSHVPVEKSKWPEDVVCNVHGHFHNNAHRTGEFPFYSGAPDYRLLAVEHTDLKPVLLEEFLGISFDAKRKRPTRNYY